MKARTEFGDPATVREIDPLRAKIGPFGDEADGP
jgi:hypothetical protein